jgi:hypothetical protein
MPIVAAPTSQEILAEDSVEHRAIVIEPGMHIETSISVDWSQNRLYGIYREFDWPLYLKGDGTISMKAEEMRRMSVEEHIQWFQSKHSDMEFLSTESCGNPAANILSIVITEGKIFSRADEPIEETAYPMLISWQNPDLPLSIETIRILSQQPPRLYWVEADKEINPQEIRFAVSGIEILRDSSPIPIEEIFWDDLRHVIEMPKAEIANVGAYFGNHQLKAKTALLRKALRGEIVELNLALNLAPGLTIPLTKAGLNQLFSEEKDSVKPVEQILKHLKIISFSERLTAEQTLIDYIASNLKFLLIRALTDAGYQPTLTPPRKPGQYRLNDENIEIVFKEAKYAHHYCGITPDCRYISVYSAGQAIDANRKRPGLTIREAQRIAQSLGLRRALIIDNGYDCQFTYKGLKLVSSCRTQLRALIIHARSKLNRNSSSPYTGIIVW